MDIQIYETFLEVAKTLNFRAASENLNVVQSTVSNRIQALEDYYGKTLFNRSNKKVSLTQTGKILLPYAERIVKLHSEAVDVTSGIPDKELMLRVGIDKGLYNNDMLSLLNQFSKMHSDVNLKIHVEDSKRVLASLLDGRVDVGFVYNKSSATQLEFVPHTRDHFVVIADKGVIEKTTDPISKKSFLELDLIHVGYGSKFASWLGQIAPEGYTYTVELDRDGLPVDHVAGMGRAAIVLESDLSKSSKANLVDRIHIKGMDMPYFQSYFAYKNSGERNKEVTSFIEVLNLQK